MTSNELEEFDELDDLLEEYQPLNLQTESFGAGKQWTTFKLGDETYGIDILKVQELIGYTHITILPNMPAFFKGMLNLRGLVIPVVDLRLKFGMPEKKYDKYTVIVIVKVGEKLMGIGVDSVSDVVFFAEDQIQPVEAFSTSINTDYIHGIGRSKEDVVVLLDLEYILSKEEFGLVLEIPTDLTEQQSPEPEPPEKPKTKKKKKTK